MQSRSWLLTIAYLGTNYAGWQLQENGPSVAGELEKVLATVCGERVVLHGASRTDAGVHAEGQRARVTLPKPWFEADLLRAFNGLLPAAIRVVGAAPCADDFNPRAKSKLKRYRYQGFAGEVRPPFLAATHAHFRRPLDLAAMRAAAPAFLGRHDFSAFRAAAGAAAKPERTIVESEIILPTPGVFHYRVAGPGFMHQQVRIMAGTLLEIGMGARDPATLPRLLQPGTARLDAGLTAPPEGLVLEEIVYEALP